MNWCSERSNLLKDEAESLLWFPEELRDRGGFTLAAGLALNLSHAPNLSLAFLASVQIYALTAYSSLCCLKRPRSFRKRFPKGTASCFFLHLSCDRNISVFAQNKCCKNNTSSCNNYNQRSFCLRPRDRKSTSILISFRSWTNLRTLTRFVVINRCWKCRFLCRTRKM